MIQQGQSGGNTVADKEIDYRYDAIGDVTGRSAYNYIGVGPRYDIATEAISYNPLGLVTNIAMTSHAGQVDLDNLTYSYDTLARVSTFGSIDGTAAYGYDPTSQLTSATYTAAAGHTEPPNLSLAFDKNGNRTSADGTMTTVGGDNHLTSDGTFTFAYDAAGNLITRTRISTAYAPDYKTMYSWDYRNRLTDVEFYDNNGTLTQHVHYMYDVWNNVIERDLDPSGSVNYTEIANYVWDGNNVVLAFNGSLQLTSRYLNGPNTSAYDQYPITLAEEDVMSTGQTGSLTFDLQDQQGSVTDIADDDGNLADHIIYVSTGGVFSESNPSVTHFASFQGGYLDPVIGMVKFGARWEYMADAFWASQDPIGFGGEDTNLSRFAGNDPTNNIDPSGLAEHRKQRPSTGPKHQEGQARAERDRAAKAERDAAARAKSCGKAEAKNIDKRIEDLAAQRKSLNRRNLKKPSQELGDKIKQLDNQIDALKNLKNARNARGGFVCLRPAPGTVAGARSAAGQLARTGGKFAKVAGPAAAAGVVIYDTVNTPYDESTDCLLGPHADAFVEGVLDQVTPVGIPRPGDRPPTPIGEPLPNLETTGEEPPSDDPDYLDYVNRLKALQENRAPLAPPD